MTIEDIKDQMADDGYAIIPEAIGSDQVAWARSELEAIVASTPVGRDDFEGHLTRRVYGLFGKTRSLDALAVHESVLGVLDGVLGHYQLSAPTGISIGPGETAQPLHPDDALYPVPRPHAEIVVNVMWPLQDFTAANGATRIVPGSHRWTDERPGPQAETVTVEIPAGTALIYTDSIWHGGGANLSDRRSSRCRAALRRRRGCARSRTTSSSSHRSGRRRRTAPTAPGAPGLQHPPAVHRLRRRPPSPQTDRRGGDDGQG